MVSVSPSITKFMTQGQNIRIFIYFFAFSICLQYNFKMFFYSPISDFCASNYVYCANTLFLYPNLILEEKNCSTPIVQQPGTQPHKNIEINALEKLLIKKHKKSKCKIWSEEQDALLIELIESKTDWDQIANRFQGKSLFVCQRRYKRLKKQNQKWPKENEQKIKYLYQVEKLPWRQIAKYFPKYNKKQIKERYKNFLQVDVKRAAWTIQQDLKLWKLVKQHGNCWVNFTKVLKGRSQLQLKNRFNKFIKPLQSRLVEHDDHQVHLSASEESLSSDQQ